MSAQQSSRHILISRLLDGLADIDRDVAVSGVALDSRKINPGDLFMACHGSQTEGNRFINDAIRAGAVAIAVESDQQEISPTGNIPVYSISGLRRQAGLVAARFYDFPSREMNVVGVTGTNGKTSVTWLIAQALENAGTACGLAGTLGYGIAGRLTPGMTTTPDPISLQSLLAQWHGRNINHVAMEVSSHALDQGRVTGVDFDVAVFTNLSRDHLDYHKTMTGYADAKRLLFESSSLKCTVLNLDDAYGRKLASGPGVAKKIGYVVIDGSTERPSSQMEIVSGRSHIVGDHISIIEIESPWGKGQMEMKMATRFKISNLLACLSALCVLDIPLDSALESLSRCREVPGRMECFGGGSAPLLVVDYAHTPDALQQVLSSLRPLCRGQLVCVFGCGGDRDRGKRPLMGKIAELMADKVVLTNDNPRSEDPDTIIEDILTGIGDRTRINIEKDRAIAIEDSVRDADCRDIVVVAGKGHETWQEISGKRYPFSDRELVRRLAEEIQ